MDGRDVIAAHYLVASERIVDTLTRHWLAKAWIQKKEGAYTHATNQTNQFPRPSAGSATRASVLVTERWHTSAMGSLPSRFPFGSGSRSRVTWPQKPAQVVVQRRGSLRDTEPEKISLRTLIETRCPSVLTPFKPAWWLFKYALGPVCRH